jgi:hypothetical protein
MGDITTTAGGTTAPRISAEESARRREAVRWADAHNRIEGLARSPGTEPIYEAFVRGEIEFDDILPRLKALHNNL